MKNKLIYLLAWLLMAILGCEGSGFKHDPTELYPEFNVNDYWIDKFDQRGLHNIEIDSDKLYCNTTNGYKGQDFLYCFDFKSGKVLWKVKVKNYASQKVEIDSSGMFYVSYVGDIIRVDLNGKLVWESKLKGSYGGHTINPVSNNLIVRTVTGGFYEYNVNSGNIENHFADNKYSRMPKFVGDKMLFASKNKHEENASYAINCINQFSKDLIWRASFKPKTSINDIIALESKVLVATGNRDGNIIYCYDLNAGEKKWEQTSIKQKVGELSTVIRFGLCDNKVFAFFKRRKNFVDLETGKVVKKEIDCKLYSKKYTISKNDEKYDVNVNETFEGHRRVYQIEIKKH